MAGSGVFRNVLVSYLPVEKRFQTSALPVPSLCFFFRRRSERIYHTVIAGEIGPGLCVGHAIAGGIIMNDKTRIGKNCNIHHGVTIGVKNRGCAVGVPVFGDNVYIGPGAKVIGGIRIGNNVAIGANAVVTHDVPDNAVVGGVPARILSHNGSSGLINRCA